MLLRNKIGLRNILIWLIMHFEAELPGPGLGMLELAYIELAVAELIGVAPEYTEDTGLISIPSRKSKCLYHSMYISI